VIRLVRWAVALPAICLASCSGSLFQSKAAPPSIYVLSPVRSSAAAVPAAGTPAAAVPVDLMVLKPKLRPGLESDRIVVQYADRRMDYFADARWSGPLGDVLQDFVMQELRTHANLRTVSGDASAFGSAYWLEIEVTDFQAEYTSAAAPTVHVHVLARLGSSGDRRILGQFAANAQQQATENRLTAIVDAYAHAADAALTQIVADTEEALTKISEAR
jgi:cholesterol transport system auxiliary component